MVIYLDELFFLNLVINYLLLLASAMLCSAPLRRGRMLLSAGLGALYACFTFFPELQLIYTISGKILFSVFMSLAAYGYQNFRTFLKRTLLFYLVGFFFAGAMMALFRLTNSANATVQNGVFYADISSGVLIAVSLAAYLILTLLLRGSPRLSERAPPRTTLEITLYGHTMALDAMIDTGNQLSDPLTNGRVVVAEYNRIKTAFPPEIRTMLDVFGVSDAAATLRMLAGAGCGEGFRLIPYSAIGSRHGLLLAFKPDSIRQEERELTGTLLALTETALSEETGCGAVLGA